MHVCVVAGARPQFIKASELIRGGRREGLSFSLVHTGQHYDHLMSDVFFDELDIPAPDRNLEVGSGLHGWQTGEMMRRFEDHLMDSGSPDWVVVFGDTNSTLAASVTAAKLNIPVAHVEAGLRSYDRSMPEEINRIVTDRISTLLFCPSELAVAQLASEGIVTGVHNTGDIMFDSVVRHRYSLSGRAGLVESQYGSDPWVLATVHRAANTVGRDQLDAVLDCLAAVNMPVIWPIHPRTRNALEAGGSPLPENIRLIEPLGYLDMLAHISAATCILTDSGGVQKEAFWLGTPCITLRETTEWPETIDQNWNVLVGTDRDLVRQAVKRTVPSRQSNPYGDGDAAQRIAALLIMAHQGA